MLRLSGAIGISVILELFRGYFYSPVFTVHYLISQQAKNIQNKKVKKKFRKYKIKNKKNSQHIKNTIKHHKYIRTREKIGPGI